MKRQLDDRPCAAFSEKPEAGAVDRQGAPGEVQPAGAWTPTPGGGDE